jgi:hypothetical protein
MRRCVARGSTRLIAGGVLSALLLVTSLPLVAQPAAQNDALRQGAVYDKAHEVAIHGTVNRIVTQHVAGSPAGLHVLVNGDRGLVDAHLGPFMTKQTEQALRSGTPVQIVGAMQTVHGKQYLLAREVNFASRTVTVRNESGALLRVQATQTAIAKHRHASRVEVKGGVQ